MFIAIALIVAGAYGAYKVGRVTESALSARRAVRAKSAELEAFQQMCDECHVVIGEISDGDTKGGWLFKQIKIGGLLYTTTHNLPVGSVIAMKLSSENCR